MHVSFKAQDVSYTEAIGGEIVQVAFHEDEDNGKTEITKPYLLISVNYEFPPIQPHVEWFDGAEFNGGAQIVKYKLEQKSFQAWLDNNMSFDIKFNIEEPIFKEIGKLLVDLYGKG
ncbi:MAG: hypothetical protein U9N57_12400 [Pseudomonadota bacterium]|nr:hypothetical protein [Pseudomonadota bacterium]